MALQALLASPSQASVPDAWHASMVRRSLPVTRATHTLPLSSVNQWNTPKQQLEQARGHGGASPVHEPIQGEGVHGVFRMPGLQA